MNKKNIKYIFSLILIPFFGFILLNLTFLLFALFYFSVSKLVNIFVTINPEMNWYWFPSLMRFCFMVIILLITFFIFRSKLKTIFKAIFLIVPVATVLVIMETFLYNFPAILFVLGFLLISGVIYYLYKTKQPWIYYYSLILTSLVLVIFFAPGGDI